MTDKNKVAVIKENNFVVEKTYDNFIKKYSKKISEINKSVLQTYWEIGGHISKMLSEALYGDKKIEDISNALQLSKSMLYACKQMFEIYSLDEIQTKFIDTRVGFHTVCKLLSIPDANLREEARQKLLAGELTLKDLQRFASKKVQAAVAEDNELSLEEEQTLAQNTNNEPDEDEDADEDEDEEEEEDVDLTLEDVEEQIKQLADTASRETDSDKANLLKIKTAISKFKGLAKMVEQAGTEMLNAVNYIEEISTLEVQELGMEALSTGRDRAKDLSRNMASLCEAMRKYVL